jgi:hypothetical protein
MLINDRAEWRAEVVGALKKLQAAGSSTSFTRADLFDPKFPRERCYPIFKRLISEGRLQPLGAGQRFRRYRVTPGRSLEEYLMDDEKLTGLIWPSSLFQVPDVEEADDEEGAPPPSIPSSPEAEWSEKQLLETILKVVHGTAETSINLRERIVLLEAKLEETLSILRRLL